MGEVEIPEGCKGIAVPAQELADKAGNSRGANTIMFGVMMATGMTKLPDEAFVRALEENFAKKPKLIPMNVELLKVAKNWTSQNI